MTLPTPTGLWWRLGGLPSDEHLKLWTTLALPAQWRCCCHCCEPFSSKGGLLLLLRVPIDRHFLALSIRLELIESTKHFKSLHKKTRQAPCNAHKHIVHMRTQHKCSRYHPSSGTFGLYVSIVRMFVNLHTIAPYFPTVFLRGT